MRRVLRVSCLVLAGVLVAGVIAGLPAAAVVPGVNKVVNFNVAGTAVVGNLGTQIGQVSDDGNISVFNTSGVGIVDGVPHGQRLYKRDMEANITTLEGVDSDNQPISLEASDFAMSNSGRYVIFRSHLGNIVKTHSVPSGAFFHIYIRDMHTGTNTLVDQSESGILANGNAIGDGRMAVSDDGRFVTFQSTAGNLLGGYLSQASRLYIKDMLTNKVILASASNDGSFQANVNSHVAASCDGSLVAFSTSSTGLTPEDTGKGDVYLVDIRNGYRIVNLTHDINDNVGMGSMSCNGRYLLMRSKATNITSDSRVAGYTYEYRYDRITNKYELIHKAASGYVSTKDNLSTNSRYRISDDGKVVFFSRDKNLVTPGALYEYEFYIRNPEKNTTELLPVDSSGLEHGIASTPSGPELFVHINSRGTHVIYNTSAPNIVPGVLGKKLIVSEVK